EAAGDTGVASYGRSAIRLNVESVSLILQSCLGGVAKDFNVQHLSGWMFQFSVTSKNVGFLVCRSGSFKCNLFGIFFALLGDGGANLQRQYDLWLSKQQASWTYVSRKSSGKLYAYAARAVPAPGSNGKLVFHHLKLVQITINQTMLLILLMAPQQWIMRVYFDQVHQVCNLRIQPCHIGKVFVTFGSPFERGRFLGKIF
uniref:Uncharacterized protein n=1 Tax=Setaria italica TaxID=4555 RepID=K3Z092_SETIT